MIDTQIHESCLQQPKKWEDKMAERESEESQERGNLMFDPNARVLRLEGPGTRAVRRHDARGDQEGDLGRADGRLARLMDG